MGRRYREHDADWRARRAINSFSRRKAQHVADLCASMVGEHLLGYPFVLLHPHLYELADRAITALADPYQAVVNVPKVGTNTASFAC